MLLQVTQKMKAHVPNDLGHIRWSVCRGSVDDMAR
jgi:hypothetical protein